MENQVQLISSKRSKIIIFESYRLISVVKFRKPFTLNAYLTSPQIVWFVWLHR